MKLQHEETLSFHVSVVRHLFWSSRHVRVKIVTKLLQPRVWSLNLTVQKSQYASFFISKLYFERLTGCCTLLIKDNSTAEPSRVIRSWAGNSDTQRWQMTSQHHGVTHGEQIPLFCESCNKNNCSRHFQSVDLTADRSLEEAADSIYSVLICDISCSSGVPYDRNMSDIISPQLSLAV